MKGQALWDELEKRGREKYKLNNDFSMYEANIADDEVAKVSFATKNSKGKFNKLPRVKGFVVWSDLNELTHEKECT